MKVEPEWKLKVIREDTYQDLEEEYTKWAKQYDIKAVGNNEYFVPQSTTMRYITYIYYTEKQTEKERSEFRKDFMTHFMRNINSPSNSILQNPLLWSSMLEGLKSKTSKEKTVGEIFNEIVENWRSLLPKGADMVKWMDALDSLHDLSYMFKIEKKEDK